MPEASHGAPLAFPRAPFSTAGSRPPPERLKLRLSPANELVLGRECRVAVPAFSDSTFIANCGDRDTRAAARRRPLTLLRLGLERPGLSWQRGLPKKSMVTQRARPSTPFLLRAGAPTLPVVGLTGVRHVGAGALRGEGNAEGAPAPVLVLSRKG